MLCFNYRLRGNGKQMLTLEPVIKESDLTNVCGSLAKDPEGLNWLAFYENPENWMKTLAHATRKALVAYVDGLAAGFIDLEFDRAGRQAVISYYLSPEFRGQGYAREFLASSLAWIKENTSARVVFAYANTENTQSIRVLDKANFRYETKRQDMLCFVTALN